VSKLLELIRGGRIYDLTHDIYHNMPYHPSLKPPMVSVLNIMARDGYETREITISTHHGTHVDAPSHMVNNAKTVDGYSPNELIRPAVIIKLTGLRPGEEIKPSHLSRFEYVIKRNEAVLINTGWSSKRGFGREYLYEWPYIGLDAANYLVSVNDRLGIVGIDGLSIAGGPESRPIDVHRVFMMRNVLIIEELNFTRIEPELKDRDYIEGVVIVAPLLIRGGDGAPARVFFITGV
jgi:kynurenine formamidase